MNHNRNQGKMFNMFLMVGHYSTPTMASRSIYDDVYQMYVNHVKQRYGTAVLGFDGCTNEPSTTDAIHLIRTRTCSGVTVHFTGDMLIHSKKDKFVSNKENKACVGQCQAGC